LLSNIKKLSETNSTMKVHLNCCFTLQNKTSSKLYSDSMVSHCWRSSQHDERTCFSADLWKECGIYYYYYFSLLLQYFSQVTPG